MKSAEDFLEKFLLCRACGFSVRIRSSLRISLHVLSLSVFLTEAYHIDGEARLLVSYSSSMNTSRKKFVLFFVIFGFGFLFVTTSLLGSMGPRGFPQSPDSILQTGSDSPVAWKRTASAILVPVKIILIGPLLLPQIHFLKEDPPPPLIGVYLVCYWSVLALILRALIGKILKRF